VRRPFRHRDIFGIAAGPLGQVAGADEDRVADRAPGDAGAAFDDASAHLDAGDRRQSRHPGIGAATHQHFGHADADRIGPHQNLALARARRRQFDIFEDRRIAGSAEQNGFHRGPPTHCREAAVMASEARQSRWSGAQSSEIASIRSQ